MPNGLPATQEQIEAACQTFSDTGRLALLELSFRDLIVVLKTLELTPGEVDFTLANGYLEIVRQEVGK